MTRRLLAVLVAGLLIAAPAVSHAQSISLAGGLSMPVGDLADADQSGFNGTLGFNFGAPLIPVGARLEAAYNGFNHKNNVAGDTRVMSGTINALVGLGMPYLIGGIGYYNARIKTTVGTLTASESEGGAGFNIGGGLTFPLPSLSPFVEVRYHQMLGDNDGVKFVPITFGIKF
jgi:opacity protein-like surface antigen